MDTYIWQLILWVLMFFFGSPLAAWIAGAISLLVAAKLEKPAVGAVGIVVAWVLYGVLALISAFNAIRSIIELVQAASGG